MEHRLALSSAESVCAVEHQEPATSISSSCDILFPGEADGHVGFLCTWRASRLVRIPSRPFNTARQIQTESPHLVRRFRRRSYRTRNPDDIECRAWPDDEVSASSASKRLQSYEAFAICR